MCQVARKLDERSVLVVNFGLFEELYNLFNSEFYSFGARVIMDTSKVLFHSLRGFYV